MANVADDRKKLELIGLVKKYAVEELGFDDSSFERVQNGKEMKYACYTVYLSPKTKLRVVYENFFNEINEETVEELKRLLNCDIYVRGFKAYGREDTPVTKALLEGSPTSASDTIFHEKFHISVKEYMSFENLMINESAANTIGMNESINFVKRFYGEQSKEYRDAVWHKELKLLRSKAMHHLAEVLNELYESGRPEHDILMEKARAIKNYNKDIESYWPENNKISKWFKISNNADLADNCLYDLLFPVTDDIYMRYGNKAIGIFTLAMKRAMEEGFHAGVNELLKYYSGSDREKYRNIINVADNRE